ncbi:MAG: TonB-dependent receptor [Acidobacteriia bacterium]|nr:TonB-dependent receptor [Terriglobia bacterium]
MNSTCVRHRRLGLKVVLGLGILLGVCSLTVKTSAAPGSAIDGTVKDLTGAVVPGAAVDCIDQLGTRVTTTTNSQGYFRCAISPRRSYQLVVNKPGFTSGTILVDPVRPGEAKTLEIKLRLSGRNDSVVVSASLSDQPITQVGSSMTVISKEELDQQAAQLVSDIVRQIPGLAVSDAGRRGGVTSMFARGGNSNYDLVLLDGIKLNDFGGGLGFDFAHLTADDVQSIEVVRGPQSALYGSEAIGATINIVTPHGEGAPAVTFQSEGGSFEMRRFAFGANGLNRGFDWDLNLSRLQSEGANFNDNYRNQNLFAHLSREISERTRLGLNFNANANDSGVPGAYGSDPDQTFFGLDLFSRDKNNNYATGGYLEHEFSPKIRERLESSVVSNNFRFISPIFGDSFTDNLRAGLRSETNVLISPHDVLAFGFEYQHERFFNSFVAEPSGAIFALRRNDFGYFAENRWNWQQRLFITAGLRIENFRTDGIPAVPFSHDQAISPSGIVSVNPKVSAAYFLRSPATGSGFSHAKLHGSFGTGIREPNGFELAFTSNPRLKPERSLSFDGGVETAWWNTRVVADVTYFFNDFKDQIVTLTGDLRNLSTFSSDNLGNARAQGLECVVSVQPNRSLRFSGQYTFLHAEILSLTGAPGRVQSIFKVGDPLLRRPAHSGALQAAWTRKRLTLTADAYFRGPTLEVEPNLGTFACDLGLPCLFHGTGYVDANVGGSYQFTNAVTGYARVNNFLNRRYEEVLGFPAYRLNFLAGIRIQLGGEKGWSLK